jgi:diguanylate cyclase (GGDEF)-like protein
MHVPGRADAASAASPARRGWLARRVATIRFKLWLAFLAFGGIIALVGLFAVHGIERAGDLVVARFDGSLAAISHARAAAADFAAMQGAHAGQAAAPPFEAEAAEARIAARADLLRQDLAIATARTLSERSLAAARGAADAAAGWQQARQAQDWQAMEESAAAATESLERLVGFTAGDALLHRQGALDAIAAARALNIAALVAALLLSALVTAVLGRRLIGPVAAASRAAGTIAAGRLDTPIPAAGHDELGVLMIAMARMRDRIRAKVEAEVARARHAQGRLVDALEGSRDGVVLVDGAGRIVTANSAAVEFFGPAATLLAPGQDFQAFAAQAGLPPMPSDMAVQEAALAGGTWLRIARTPTREGGFVAIFGDITALKRTTVRLDAALSNMSQGLVMFDADNRLSVANRRLYDLFDLPPHAGRPGITLGALLHAMAKSGLAKSGLAARGGQPDPVAAFKALVAAGQPATALFELADGRALSVSHQPMAGGGWVATFADITARRRAEARIAYLARHDALTGLPNRTAFLERLEAAVAQAGRGSGCAVMLIDVDDFRALNLSRGSHGGDAVLKEVGQRLAALVRETDTLARLGADEFGIIQAGIERPEDAAQLARRLVQQLDRPVAVDGVAVAVGISCGIAVAPADGTGAHRLLRNADAALVRARRDGRGGFRFFEAVLDARVQQRQQLEVELRQALAQGAFELHYQPLVEVASGRVQGFEALARWHHPVRGIVAPSVFIPLAEQMGLIGAIGDWAIRAATQAASAWPAGLSVAVNVSPMQFASPRLVEVVGEALGESGLAPHRLELEVTESALLAESEPVQAMLHRLKAMGVRIALDDFGTGYSALAYLRSFPFDKIKIDQSFVRAMAGDAGTGAIVRAISALGRDLGMRVAAEGVETEAQLALLRQAACTDVQGFLFSHPVPEAEVAGVIARIEGLRVAA